MKDTDTWCAEGYDVTPVAPTPRSFLGHQPKQDMAMADDDLPTLLAQLDEESSSSSSDDAAARQSQLLQALRHRHLSSSSTQRQDLSTEQTHETIDALLTSMGTHLPHAAVQRQCLAALSSVAHDAEANSSSSSGSGSSSSRDYLVARGALALAAEAMRNHANDGAVQAAAGALLTTVVCAGDNAAADVRAKAGRELGMISLVVAALREHRGHAKVARYGCAALGGLAGNDDAANCAAMGEAGAVEAVLDVVGRYGGVRGGGGATVGHDDDENDEEDDETVIVDRALSALDTMTAADKKNRDRLAQRHGSVATIVAALRGHEANGRMTQHGLALVRRLVEASTPCADGCARCGSAAVLVAAMGAHPDHGGIQTHGLALFRRLASTDPRRMELGLAGAVERTVRAMTMTVTATEAAAAGDDDRELQFQAAAALHNLSIDSEKNGDRVGAAGGIAALLRAIRRFEEDEALVDVCCRTLHRISYVGTNKGRIRKEDPINLLHNVAQRYANTCGRTAKGVLKNI